MENYENGYAPAEEEQNLDAFAQDTPAAEETAAPQQKSILEMGKDIWAKFLALPKMVWIGIGAAIAAVVALCIVFSIITNTYKTPISIMQKLENSKSYKDPVEQSAMKLNGFLEKEVKQLGKIMKKSDDYADELEDAKDAFEDRIQDMKDQYGNNYKIKYKVTEKEKLEKDDLKDFRDELREYADYCERIEEECDDYDSDDWEEMADELGISKSQAKEMVKIMKEIGKVCKKAKVSNGYELTVVRTVNGSEMDEPEEDEMTIYVYKVNGRWISGDALSLSIF